MTDRCLAVRYPMWAGTTRGNRSIEEHSSRRQVVPGQAFAHATGGGAAGAIARIEERAIGSVWGDGKVLQSPRARVGRCAGAGLVTASAAGARTGEPAARSTVGRGGRLTHVGYAFRWPQPPTATMRAAVAGFKRVVYGKVYSDASTGDGEYPQVRSRSAEHRSDAAASFASVPVVSRSTKPIAFREGTLLGHSNLMLPISFPSDTVLACPSRSSPCSSSARSTSTAC